MSDYAGKINTERRKRDLFEAALAQPEAEWPRFIANATRDDPSVGQAVLRLLREAHRPPEQHVLDRPVHPRRAASATAAGPSKIGPYTVVRPAGSGGMGTVYVCQAPASGELVAVKLIRSDLQNLVTRQQFERERRILSRLHHPNVCSILDAGVTDAGLPFIVMQYVEGVSIADYCRNTARNTSDRLLLYSQVLAGVEYFHRENVAHRDLKPSNILITRERTASILDFGIAKMIEHPRGFTGRGPTNTKFPFYTVRYASPEQLDGRLSGRASDIYSLGVICYELLTGQHPYPNSYPQGAVALRQAMHNRWPQAPSAVAASAGCSLSQSVDHMIYNALRFDPAERYQTAGSFLKDLIRCLEGRPVALTSSRPMVGTQSDDQY